METEALIRYACVTAEGMDVDSGALTLPYLRAFMGTQLGVRVMPIGMVAMWHDPWNKVPQVFTSALKTRFINVVCVPPGLKMGGKVSVGQFGSDRGSQTAYEPPTAIPGLLTVGIPNVAILTGDKDLQQKEVDSLKLYTEVLCPTKHGADTLIEQGVKAIQVPPHSESLLKLISGINLL